MTTEIKVKRSVLIVIAAIIEHIDKQPMTKKTTDEFAADFNINRKLLQKGFKKTKGLGIKEYHNIKRMEACKDLLKQGDLSIKQVSMLCLFKSQRAFSNAFKKMYDITPTEYQNGLL